jgi:hypothetical protein
MVEKQSEKYKLNKTDLKKIGKGALIAGVGAIATYGLEIIPNVDFGEYTPVIVALISVIFNAILKYSAGK